MNQPFLKQLALTCCSVLFLCHTASAVTVDFGCKFNRFNMENKPENCNFPGLENPPHTIQVNQGNTYSINIAPLHISGGTLYATFEPKDGNINISALPTLPLKNSSKLMFHTPAACDKKEKCETKCMKDKKCEIKWSTDYYTNQVVFKVTPMT